MCTSCEEGHTHVSVLHMCPSYLLAKDTHTCVPLNKKDTCVMPFRNLQANLTIELLGSGPIEVAAQLSLHDAPIFRLLLKIAVF
jgi:hypothetical protein